jgi:hypothetical protein
MEKAQTMLHAPASALDRIEERVVRLVHALDPSPRSGPLPAPFVASFVVLTAVTTTFLVVNKYLPGQDISYHAHCVRVWLDAGRSGSAYAAYEPAHWLEANTLMYTVAAFFSPVMGAFKAFRFVQAYYFIGLPLACLYALRALERSPWGSLLAFPLCYTEIFAAGYANMGFAAPTFIFALVTYGRLVQHPTWSRAVASGVLFIVVFLSHVHVYLWLGGLLLFYSLGYAVARLGVVFGSSTERRTVGLAAAGAVAAALPSLVLFWRWYARGYGAGNSIGEAGRNRAFQSAMEWAPLSQRFQAGALQAFQSTTSPMEAGYIAALGLLLLLSMSLARTRRDSRIPLPELAILVTVISFYVLPAGIAGQGIAVRQWYFVFWLLPIVIEPLPFLVHPVRSGAVIAGIFAWTILRLSLVGSYLRRFTSEEMAGFDRIVAAAPREPGLLTAYAAINPRSKYWLTSSHYHSYGFLDAQRSYDGPLEYSDATSVAAVRYTKGPPLPIKHLYFNASWAKDPGIWKYDLVLVRTTVATAAAQAALAGEHGNLIVSAGDWQLWRRK